MIITETKLKQIIKESIAKYSQQQIIEIINNIIKQNIGNGPDAVEADLYEKFNIECYDWGYRRFRSHFLTILKVENTDIYIELLYGHKTEEWGYVYDIIDGIAAEFGSPKFKEYHHKWFFPNGRKNSKVKNNNQQAMAQNSSDIYGNGWTSTSTLNESQLRNIISESIKNILKKGLGIYDNVYLVIDDVLKKYCVFPSNYKVRDVPSFVKQVDKLDGKKYKSKCIGFNNMEEAYDWVQENLPDYDEEDWSFTKISQLNTFI